MCCDHSKSSCVLTVPVFKGLQIEEVKALNEVVNSRVFRRGEYIFQEGEASEALYIVHTGTVKVSKVSDEGKEQIIRILFPGDFFGQYALMENRLHYATAEVLEESTVCVVHKKDFKEILERNPKMALNFMIALSDLLQKADEWMGTISLLEVERRLAKALILFIDQGASGEYRQFPVSKKDFASLIGATPETLSRKLVTLQNLEIIEMDGRRGIRILNANQLKQIAG